ncbi:glycoside hydrolase [Hypoxylon sp. FL0890]|nr:glycoside hydrolase [Hypoxylon sp. FL0890]
MFTPNGNEIAFDLENAELGCGLNGAVYFVSVDEDGAKSRYPSNKAGAKYGTGYCDSQCARDLKWIGGKANAEGWQPSKTDKSSGIGNKGACCAEMDLWEANSMSSALIPHPCQKDGYFVCKTSDCGGTYSDNRPSGSCDPDGCDLNPFHHGDANFYGKGETIDTSKSSLVYFIQNVKEIELPKSKYVSGGSTIDVGFCDAAKDVFKGNKRFQEMGGLTAMGKAPGKPMVLVMSVWDEAYANMLWLDGQRYPLGCDPSEPGVPRGECDVDGSKPEKVREKFKNAKVTYSNFKFGPIEIDLQHLRGTRSLLPRGGHRDLDTKGNRSLKTPGHFTQ